MKSSSALALCMLTVVWTSQSGAHDLGVIGPVYEITEEDALVFIERTLKAREASGELEVLQERARARAEASIDSPEPVSGLSVAASRSVRMVDPTVVYERAVFSDDGRMVIPAGTRVNPLKVMSLTKRMVFFDGRDEEQFAAVGRLVAAGGRTVKPIMVGGSWREASRAWGTQVYFDQKAVLSKRFGLRAVPAVVSQQGDLLQIEEVPAKELQ